jgi:excisionase family DNA binding protein
MEHLPNDDMEGPHRRLRSRIDAVAASLAELLDAVCRLLIEMAQPKAVPEQRPTEAPPLPNMLTVAQAADYLGTKPQTLGIWRCTGRYSIPYVKVGRNVRYRRADLDRFLRSRTKHRGHEDES